MSYYTAYVRSDISLELGKNHCDLYQTFHYNTQEN